MSKYSFIILIISLFGYQFYSQGQVMVLNYYADEEIPTEFIITNADQTKTIFSIYDDNYLPYSVPTGSATTTAVSPDEFTEALIDSPGVIGILGSDNEITVNLSYNATGVVTYPSVYKVVSIPSTLIEGGGGPIDLIFEYPSGISEVGSGTITAKIYASSTLFTKKLDINSGIGENYDGVEIAQFSIDTDSSGGNGIIKINLMAGIPDRNFNKEDNTGSTTSHNFMYLPIKLPNGQVWLKHNLGAHYTQIGHPNYDPAKVPGKENAYLAWGSWFQWGRAADGHEIATHTSTSFEGSTYTGTTPDRIDIPPHALFISWAGDNTPNVDGSWHNDNNFDRWNGVNALNNPCPYGFRVPNEEDWDTLIAEGNTGTENPNLDELGLTTGYSRNSNGVDFNNSAYFAVSVSSVIYDGAFRRTMGTNTLRVNTVNRKNSWGSHVRCILD